MRMAMLVHYQQPLDLLKGNARVSSAYESTKCVKLQLCGHRESRNRSVYSPDR